MNAITTPTLINPPNTCAGGIGVQISEKKPAAVVKLVYNTGANNVFITSFIDFFLPFSFVYVSKNSDII